MFELLGAIFLSILSVVSFAISIGNFLPEYKLTEKIPEPKIGNRNGVKYLKREKGVKYFNDPELLERVKYTDLQRILHGERTTITDTPVVNQNTKDETRELYKEVKFRAEIYSDSDQTPYSEALKKAKLEVAKEHLRDIALQGGAHNPRKNRIQTWDKSEHDDEATYPHEDTHAFISRKSKHGKEVLFSAIETGKLVDEKKLLKKQETEKKHKLDIAESNYFELPDEPTDSELDRYFGEENIKSLDNISKIQKEVSNIEEDNEEISKKIQDTHRTAKPDFIATDEGLAFAMTKYYSGWNPENFKSYEDKTDPELIEKSRDLCYELMSLIGSEPTKEVVMDVMNEAYDKDTNAVELLEHRVRDYVDGTMDMFRKMTENPKEHLKGKKKD